MNDKKQSRYYGKRKDKRREEGEGERGVGGRKNKKKKNKEKKVKRENNISGIVEIEGRYKR